MSVNNNQTPEELAEQILNVHLERSRSHKEILFLIKKAITQATEPLQREIEALRLQAQEDALEISRLVTAAYERGRTEAGEQIVQLESQLAALTEWATNHSNLTNNGKCRDCGVEDSGMFGMAPARGRHWGDCETGQLLTNTTQSALERDKKLREAVIDECLAKVKRMAIPNASFVLNGLSQLKGGK